MKNMIGSQVWLNSKHSACSKHCHLFHDNLKHQEQNNVSTKKLWMNTREEIVISTEETSGGRMRKKDFSEDKKKNERGIKNPKTYCCTRTTGYHRSDDFLSVIRTNKRGYPVLL